MERQTDQRQGIHFFFSSPDLEKHPVTKYWSDILWMENLEVSVWPHSMWGFEKASCCLHTYSQGVSVVVGRTKVSIPTKHNFLGNDSSDHVIHHVRLTRVVAYTCNLSLKSLEQIWHQHTSAKFFACGSVMNVKSFLCVAVVCLCMLMSAFLTPTWWVSKYERYSVNSVVSHRQK